MNLGTFIVVCSLGVVYGQNATNDGDDGILANPRSIESIEVNMEMNRAADDECYPKEIWVKFKGATFDRLKTIGGKYVKQGDLRIKFDDYTVGTKPFWKKGNIYLWYEEQVTKRVSKTWAIGKLWKVESGKWKGTLRKERYLTAGHHRYYGCPVKKPQENLIFWGDEVDVVPFKKVTCPDELLVELDNNVLERQNWQSGKYTKAGESGGFPYWVNGDRAMWYHAYNNQWFVGPKNKLGTGVGNLQATGMSDCPMTNADPNFAPTSMSGQNRLDYAKSVSNLWNFWDGSQGKWNSGIWNPHNYGKPIGQSTPIKILEKPFPVCPDEITVQLSGNCKKAQADRVGKYVKQTGESNGYPYWLNEKGEALWYDKRNKQWMIGSKSGLGGTSGGLLSVGARFCPTNLNWKCWYNNGKSWSWNVISKNSAGVIP